MFITRNRRWAKIHRRHRRACCASLAHAPPLPGPGWFGVRAAGLGWRVARVEEAHIISQRTQGHSHISLCSACPLPTSSGAADAAVVAAAAAARPGLGDGTWRASRAPSKLGRPTAHGGGHKRAAAHPWSPPRRHVGWREGEPAGARRYGRGATATERARRRAKKTSVAGSCQQETAGGGAEHIISKLAMRMVAPRRRRHGPLAPSRPGERTLGEAGRCRRSEVRPEGVALRGGEGAVGCLMACSVPLREGVEGRGIEGKGVEGRGGEGRQNRSMARTDGLKASLDGAR